MQTAFLRDKISQHFCKYRSYKSLEMLGVKSCNVEHPPPPNSWGYECKKLYKYTIYIDNVLYVMFIYIYIYIYYYWIGGSIPPNIRHHQQANQ